MGRNNQPRRRRPSGPPAGVIDPDALPPILGITCDAEHATDAPLNACARRLELAEGVRRALCRLGATATASRHWQSECVTAGGVTWLAVVAPANGGAQAMLLPVSVDADPGRLDDLAPGLTPREREVLTLSLRGGSPRDISAQLGISWHTVRTHLKHAYRALGVSGRAEAVSVVVESARPRVHLRMITDDVAAASSGRHSRPASKGAGAPSSGRHSRPPSRSHSKPPSRSHSKPPSRSHSKPPSRSPRPATRPPSRPR